jgi:CRP/FNR family cyclic AMP-dependent transcriptional regulator
MAKKPTPTFDPRVLLAKIAPGKSNGTYPVGHVFFRQGDPANALFFMEDGITKLTVISEQGKEAVVALVHKDDFFGEGCLAAQKRRMATATAMSDVTVLRIEKAAAMRLLREEPQFSEAFIAYLLQRSIRVEADLVDQLFNSSEKRLARLLLLLANFGKDEEPIPVIATISQQTLAQMIGTTRARVNTFMNKFRDLGFISYNGHIEVHPSLLNAVLHEKPHIKD